MSRDDERPFFDLRLKVQSALVKHVGPSLEMDGSKLECTDVSDQIATIRVGGVCGN